MFHFSVTKVVLALDIGTFIGYAILDTVSKYKIDEFHPMRVLRRACRLISSHIMVANCLHNHITTGEITSLLIAAPVIGAEIINSIGSKPDSESTISQKLPCYVLGFIVPISYMFYYTKMVSQ